MKLSKLFMKISKEMGNNHFFGIPGSGVPLDLMDSGNSIDLQFINVAHESTAAIAAGTYRLINKNSGLCLGVKGVGAGNLAGGVANAYFERMPVVCVCETTPGYSYENEMVQHTNHQDLMKSITKSMVTLTKDNPAQLIIDSYNKSMQGLKGPVLIDFPSNMGLEEVDSDYEINPINTDKIEIFGNIESLSQIISSSKKPMLIVGDGVRRDGAINEIIKLSEKIGAGVLSVMNARGVYPENHNRWVGVSTAFDERDTTRPGLLTKGSDLIILVGGDQMMTHVPWPEDKVKTVEIISDNKFKTLSPKPEVKVAGNIKTTLIKLLDSLNDNSGWEISDLNNIYKVIAPRFDRSNNAIFTKEDVLEVSKEILPTEGHLFTETGAFIAQLENTWKFDKPLKYFGSSGGRSMGLMIPAFIGGSLATNNNTPSLGIGADGSTLMRLGEFETISRANLKWPIVIINDASLGTMKYRQGFRGYSDYGLDLSMVDFARVAKSCGLKGETVSNPEEFRKSLTQAFKSNITTVIDARVDPNEYQDSFGGTKGD